MIDMTATVQCEEREKSKQLQQLFTLCFANVVFTAFVYFTRIEVIRGLRFVTCMLVKFI